MTTDAGTHRMEVDRIDALPPFPARDPSGHKGTFGTVLVIGGHLASIGDASGRTMLGAPALAATAALRSGAGCAILAMPAELLVAGLSLCPAATGVPLPADASGRLDASGAAARIDAVIDRVNAIVLGPGLGSSLGCGTAEGSHDAEARMVMRLLANPDHPIVLDADGINALAATREGWRDIRAPLVLTPHPGEFARLAAPLGITLSPTDPVTRPAAAAELARRLGAIVVLKGARTVVSDGLRTWECVTGRDGAGTPALAVGGSGDVLAGIVGGFVSQFMRRSPTVSAQSMGLFDIACWAVRLHATAGERWSQANGSAGMLPMELADAIPAAIEAVRRGTLG
jgi:ADP-dependent NAD(P)H-hydrate dehydratase